MGLLALHNKGNNMPKDCPYELMHKKYFGCEFPYLCKINLGQISFLMAVSSYTNLTQGIKSIFGNKINIT